MRSFITKSNLETIECGIHLASEFNSGDVVCFHGGLGAGKTQMIKGIVEGMECADLATSPTFNIIQEYLTGRLPIYNFDFYRLESTTELVGLGFDDYLFGDGICLMEWAEKVESFVPAVHWSINIEIIDNDSRKITIFSPGEKE